MRPHTHANLKNIWKFSVEEAPNYCKLLYGKNRHTYRVELGVGKGVWVRGCSFMCFYIQK